MIKEIKQKRITYELNKYLSELVHDIPLLSIGVDCYYHSTIRPFVYYSVFVNNPDKRITIIYDRFGINSDISAVYIQELFNNFYGKINYDVRIKKEYYHRCW